MTPQIALAGKVRWALETFSPYKRPSLEGIYPALLQQAGDIIVESLIRLIRVSLTIGQVPEAWRGTRMVFIPITGKGPKIRYIDNNTPILRAIHRQLALHNVVSFIETQLVPVVQDIEEPFNNTTRKMITKNLEKQKVPSPKTGLPRSDQQNTDGGERKVSYRCSLVVDELLNEIIDIGYPLPRR